MANIILPYRILVVACLIVTLSVPGLANTPASDQNSQAAPRPDPATTTGAASISPAAATGHWRVVGSPGAQCIGAIATAERAYGLPHGLLAAIARVESGRRDPASGRWMPWPWAIDIAGQSQFYPTKVTAIAAVRAWQARGVRSIDVGCAQVNLAQHPHAFRSLDAALDPVSNTDYAARLLVQLHSMTNDWKQAVAFYHSALPGASIGYRHKVLAVWSGETGPWAYAAAAGRRRIQPRPSRLQLMAVAWAATIDEPASSPDPNNPTPTLAPAGFDLLFHRPLPTAHHPIRLAHRYAHRIYAAAWPRRRAHHHHTTMADAR